MAFFPSDSWFILNAIFIRFFKIQDLKSYPGLFITD